MNNIPKTNHKMGWSTIRFFVITPCPSCKQPVKEAHQPFNNLEYYVCENCFDAVKKKGTASISNNH